MTQQGAMWGGRFEGGLDPRFAAFQDSLSVDHVLWRDDLRVNRAWSRALAAVGVFDAAELARVLSAIDDLEATWGEGGPPTAQAEDIHTLVEQELTARIGPLARRIHTGRSRNDQVATDLRLYLRRELARLDATLVEAMDALVELASAHADAPMPGYTHLQRGQPVTIGHHALAHAEALSRDLERVRQAASRIDRCPLGSGALAGSAFAVDREAIARDLGFTGGATHNSLDAVSARDHACEITFACSMILVHLSRLCEDYVFFSAYEVGLLRFGDAVSTGSSLMPQKRNPDAAELVRGQAGRVCGDLTALLMTVKGLPLAYNRDLQLDKPPLFDALRTTDDCLAVAACFVKNARFDVERCRREAGRGYQNATDLADLLVRRGVPFRDAHERAGRAVNRAVELGVELDALPPAEWKSLFPELDGGIERELTVDAVLARRDVLGGAAPSRVRAEVELWQDRLARWRAEGERT